MCPRNPRNGLKRMKTQVTPKRLKRRWARAVLFALTLATEAAMFEVIVVPMFSPSTIAAAMVKGMYPWATRTMVIAIVAAEDWSMRVMQAPATMKMRMLPTPHPVSPPRNCRTGSLSSRTVDVSLRVVRPRNSRANPIMNSPMLLYFLFFAEMAMKAKNIRGTAIAPRLKEPAPKERAKIQAVTVVPMFAPMMTAMAVARERRPAFTKLTSMRVVAVEDWTRAVTVIPVRMHLKVFEVIFDMKDLILSPAIFWRPPLIRDIP